MLFKKKYCTMIVVGCQFYIPVNKICVVFCVWHNSPKQQGHHVLSTVFGILHLKNLRTFREKCAGAPSCWKYIPWRVFRGTLPSNWNNSSHKNSKDLSLLRWPWKICGPIKWLPSKPHHTIQLKQLKIGYYSFMRIFFRPNIWIMGIENSITRKLGFIAK